ncbi:hypothetical protein ACF09J_14305 [Streptomyces sp. NPDC014889]|uniref:hypothetical protein n=1 Tax=Streptomyces sp. NPDC014889 TaxID=3364928 RepID=UPI0036FA1991
MTTRGRGIRLTAVLAAVLLALTGFSRGHGHGRGHSRHSGGGGGCSSSHQNHDSSSSRGRGSTARPLRDATVRLIGCATRKKPYATVEIDNPNDSRAEFQARVAFYDADGTLLLTNSSPLVAVPAKGRATTEVRLDGGHLPAVDHCEPDPTASPAD